MANHIKGTIYFFHSETQLFLRASLFQRLISTPAFSLRYLTSIHRFLSHISSLLVLEILLTLSKKTLSSFRLSLLSYFYFSQNNFLAVASDRHPPQRATTDHQIRLLSTEPISHSVNDPKWSPMIFNDRRWSSLIVNDHYINDRQWPPRWVRTVSLYPWWAGDVKASKPRDRIVTMHMTATSVTFQLEIVLAQVNRMKLEEDQSENVVLLFMQLKHMLWITNISWDPNRQQIPKEKKLWKENLLETKKEGK